MKKKMSVLIGVCSVVIGMIGIRQYLLFKEASQIVELDLIQDNYYETYEKKCLDFVEKNYLIEEEAITTNAMNETIVTNEQLLYMTYLLEQGNSDAFGKAISYIKDELLSQDGMIALGKEKFQIQRFSTYDQMELFKLVYKAYDKWGQEKYKNMGIAIEEHLWKEYIKEERIYPYYKLQEDQIIDTRIPLHFLDLNSLGLLGNCRNTWISVYNQSKQLIQNAYIKDAFPFYHTIYDYGDGTYNKEHKANMLDSTLVVLNLAQVKLHKQNTIEWLKAELKKGALYLEYDKETGLPTEHIESAGVYGIVAQLGKVTGDIELYTLAIEKMLRLQIKEAEHPDLGAFRPSYTEEISIYENLNALLAF